MNIIRKAEKLLIFLGFVALVIALFYPALFPPDGFMLFGDDTERSYYFFRKFFVESIRQGIVPWWNPYVFSGTPFLSNPSVSFFSPTSILFFVLPISQAFGWYVAMHVCIAMIGLYWCSHQLFPRTVSPISRFAGAVVFGLSGFFVARVYLGSVETIAAASYLPWVFGAYWRAFYRPHGSTIITAAFLLSVQLLSGYQTMALFSLEAVGVTCIFFCLYKRSIQSIVVFALVTLIGFGLSGILLVPLVEFGLLSIRQLPLPYSWSSYGSMPPVSLQQLINPFLFGDQRTFIGPPPNYSEQAFFVGRIGIVVACFGLFHWIVDGIRKKSHSNLLLVITVSVGFFALWVAMGDRVPLDINKILWDVVPLYRSIRIPPRHLVLCSFSIAIFVIAGIEYARLSVFKYLISTLLAIELFFYAQHFIGLTPLPETRHDHTLVEKMTSKELSRILPNFGTWVEPRDALDFDASVTYRLYSATGYDPSILRSYYNFIDAVNGSTQSSIATHNVQIPYLTVSSPATNFLNIRYIVVPATGDSVGPPNERFRLVAGSDTYNYRVYENLAVTPRFFMAKSVSILRTRNEVLELIRTGNVNLREIVYIGADTLSRPLTPIPNCTFRDKPKSTVVSYGINSIELLTETPCHALLVSSEVMYPGWKGYIDGKETDIIEANTAFRALLVPSGKHVVRMVYEPTSFITGGLISVITYLIAFVWLFREANRSKIRS